jgi:hypothetical protein
MIFKPGGDQLTKDEKKRICNGVGPGGLLGNMIPEFSLTELANEHDYEYEYCKTVAEKCIADVVLFINAWKKADDMIEQNTAVHVFKVVLALGHKFVTNHKLHIPEYYHRFQLAVQKWAFDNRDAELSYEIIQNAIERIYTKIKGSQNV